MIYFKIVSVTALKRTLVRNVKVIYLKRFKMVQRGRKGIILYSSASLVETLMYLYSSNN